jgi:ABC-type enterobactin transport system permease subunit
MGGTGDIPRRAVFQSLAKYVCCWCCARAAYLLRASVTLRTSSPTPARRGKHVVTANKALLAHTLPDVLAATASGGARLGFEAAVAGGASASKLWHCSRPTLWHRRSAL